MIVLDYRDRRPLYEQVIEKFQELVLQGVLEPDQQMPSVRSLAMELSINPNTIQRAYAELERIGIIYTVTGRGSFVAERDSLIEKKKHEICNAIFQNTKQAKQLGITKEVCIKQVDAAYCEAGVKE